MQKFKPSQDRTDQFEEDRRGNRDRQQDIGDIWRGFACEERHAKRDASLRLEGEAHLPCLPARLPAYPPTRLPTYPPTHLPAGQSANMSTDSTPDNAPGKPQNNEGHTKGAGGKHGAGQTITPTPATRPSRTGPSS